MVVVGGMSVEPQFVQSSPERAAPAGELPGSSEAEEQGVPAPEPYIQALSSRLARHFCEYQLALSEAAARAARRQDEARRVLAQTLDDARRDAFAPVHEAYQRYVALFENSQTMAAQQSREVFYAYARYLHSHKRAHKLLTKIHDEARHAYAQALEQARAEVRATWTSAHRSYLQALQASWARLQEAAAAPEFLTALAGDAAVAAASATPEVLAVSG